MRHTFTHLSKDFLFSYAKGGGGYVPQPDPKAEAAAQIQIEEARAKREAQAAARAEAQKQAQRERDIAASQGRVGNAYNSAYTAGTQKLTSKGLDTGTGYGADISNLFRSYLDSARSGAPEIVTDANSLFSPALFDDAYNTVRGTARQKINKDLNAFMGDGFDTQAFADNADDAILRSILDTQKGDAMSSIQSALARGQINDAGYSRALKDLDLADTAGFAKANQMGMGVLTGYRKDLNDFNTRTRSRADQYDFGDDFNVDNIRSQYDSLVGSKRNSLEGDILAAIGNTSFFDTNSLLGKATGASGVMNQSPTSAIGSSMSSPLTAAYANKNAGNTDDTKKNQVF